MTPRKNTAATEPRNARGQFGKGNPGRKPGSRNKATLAAQLMLDRGARKLTKVCIERALAGDSVALKLALERVLPAVRDRPLQVDLPMPKSAADVPATLSAIIRGASEGVITATEAQKLSQCVETFARAHELADFDARLRALEGRNAN